MTVTEKAFKDLFDREYENLCRYAVSFLEDSHLAEDIVQDTLVKFWEQRKDLVESKEAKFYLITAIRNNCITVLRKQASSGVRFTDNTPETAPEPFITGRQLREDAAEQSKKIAAALDQLPPKCKEVFLMVKLHGMSYKQTAASLDISVKTVENQMGKAIKTLREFVQSGAMAMLMIIFVLKNIFQA